MKSVLQIESHFDTKKKTGKLAQVEDEVNNFRDL